MFQRCAGSFEPCQLQKKIFGLYEHVLNNWVASAIKGKQFVLDVGANTGYDTYGFAHLLLRDGAPDPVVLAFEPEDFVELSTPRGWSMYAGCRIEVVRSYVGAERDARSVTLDDILHAQSRYLQGAGLVKMDIEGGEIDALRGAKELLDDPRHDWLIEIHGKELIPLVAQFFVERSRPFLIKDLTPIPFFGLEQRPGFTSWLVTI